jgi:EAL domain-containing protein (putative c-di-GMP-specific phosphodiesterase class I)
MGCTFGQGSLYGSPTSAAAFRQQAERPQ